ncbi:LIC11966 family surface protein [Hymenobacter convexus]|uniref:LIC11966 family surface protein n=1 Tax=Hymenobacter sp. CA1UV-4 TaxID=3063782 RepID=UPI00271324CA|nr:hypothetical protein [Hymenobacter sp. CA1UV-4]MDO7852651.1 hypothetical protein [Hymenobacter sp. CA1UV-4]
MRFFTQIVVGCFFSTCALPAAAQTFSDPASYNNAIVNEQVDLLKKNLRYISKAAHSENDRKIENRRLEVVEQNKVAVANVQRIPAAYQGNAELRAAALKAFKTMLEVYSADYKQVNALAATRTESFEAMERYYAAQEAAEAKLAVVDDSVNAAQRRFAKQFGMNIESTRESVKLAEYTRQVTAVNKYQHQVFLPYFRVQKASAKLTDALNAQDAAAFEAARVTLAAEAEKSAAELSAVPAFRGKDMAYRNAARDFANLYMVMCAKQFVQVAELMKNKDHLTKVDAQTINTHINTFNTQNQKFNEAYNRTSAAFMDTYVPVMND